MLSICTPTFNRGYTLTRLYNSLLEQKNKNFEWIIIDDGSTDNTKELVNKFILDNRVKIKYKFQNNQGKHVAVNEGQKLAQGELFLCLDSDDWLVTDALEKIYLHYKEIESNEKVCGLIFLDQFEDGEIIGSELPSKKIVNWINLMYKHNTRGDKCYVFKTNLIKEIPFYTFDKNNHMPPSYQYYLISKHYDFYCNNIPIKIVEYMPDGISQNIVKKYFSSPENYTYYRKEIHKLIPTLKGRLKNAMHYNITYLMSQNYTKLKVDDAKHRIQNIIMFPVGFMAFIYLKVRKKW